MIFDFIFWLCYLRLSWHVGCVSGIGHRFKQLIRELSFRDYATQARPRPTGVAIEFISRTTVFTPAGGAVGGQVQFSSPTGGSEKRSARRTFSRHSCSFRRADNITHRYKPATSGLSGVVLILLVHVSRTVMPFILSFGEL